mgnify:CR=1 FL=1
MGYPGSLCQTVALFATQVLKLPCAPGPHTLLQTSGRFGGLGRGGVGGGRGAPVRRAGPRIKGYKVDLSRYPLDEAYQLAGVFRTVIHVPQHDIFKSDTACVVDAGIAPARIKQVGKRIFLTDS